jgi:hypothetical protein
MDPGAMLSHYTPYLSGEVMIASASVAATAMFAASYARRQAVRRRFQKAGRSNGTENNSLSGRLLSGVYRGRAVEIDLAADGLLCVTVRIVNEQRVFDEFSADSPLPTNAWLGDSARRALAALSARWSVAIRGRSLYFSYTGHDYDPERMPRLLDLACDLADGVDASP